MAQALVRAILLVMYYSGWQKTEGSAVNTKKALPQFFWKYNNLRYKFHCQSVSILSEMLTVTYLLFVVRVQFFWEELSFKDFFMVGEGFGF